MQTEAVINSKDLVKTVIIDDSQRDSVITIAQNFLEREKGGKYRIIYITSDKG